MRMLVYLVLVVWIGVINADEERIEGSSGYLGNGVSFSMRAASPDSYDHSVGGGSYYGGVSKVDGDYYACEVEVVSLFLQISTDSTFTKSSTAKWKIELVPRSDVTVSQVLNNCVESETDNAYSCTKCGDLVEPVLTQTDAGPILEFTGLQANTKTVIRIDLIIGCRISCSFSCSKGQDGDWACVAPSSGYIRMERVSTAQTKKRDIQKHGDSSNDIDHDEYALILFFNDYQVDGGARNPISLVSVDFTNICNILSCNDYTGCTIGEVPGKTGGTYKNRDCAWYDVSCDDEDPCTIDQCLPPSSIGDNRNIPANCIHINSCEEEISGYCFYVDRNSEIERVWECDEGCTSDDDCKDGGICYFIDEGYCKSGEGEGNYCYWEEDNYSFDCSKTCSEHSDCDGGRCLTTIQCSSKFTPFLLQQENSQMDDKSKQQTTRGLGLSSSQLGGIIGGCVVGFIVILMIVIVLVKKRFHQQINTETIITLQIPLTEQILENSTSH